MFRWYQNATRCYVYLSDVPTAGNAADHRATAWEAAFRKSKWFRRGWTLQELLAPASVEFFSQEGNHLGSKQSLEVYINEITGITLSALRGSSLTDFDVEERFAWAKNRDTKRPEDQAYSLLGIFNVYMPLIYGEGKENALMRLRKNIDESSERNLSIRLEIAKEAAFDATGRDHDPHCLPGTRTDLLQDTQSWLSSDSVKPTYWLSGWAGTGKSTIARTIAQEYTNSEWQLGTFFFSRGGGDAGHIHKFVGTLAMQLSYRWPAYKNALHKVIAADEGIVLKYQKEQWAALIQKPLSKLLTTSSPRVLLVVDAVDECGTDDDMSHIIELLLDTRGINQAALRIFVTSRPEVAIRNGFSHDLSQRHLNVVLHQISEFIVQNDLFIFLHFHFTNIRQSRGLGAHWPGDVNIQRLVAMSGNLFIWAATVYQFVSEGRKRVKNRLSSILEGSYDSGGPDTALDRIYLMVLETAMGSHLSTEEKREVSHDFRSTLGTIAVLFAPLSVIDLSCILGVETEYVKETLADLHSILDVPDDTDRPIRLHHPSFRDFLYDQRRCRNEDLCVNEIEMHSMLAHRSFEVMAVLRKDICGLKNPSTMIKDVKPIIITQHLSSGLQYACRYWLNHAEHGQIRLTDDGPVHRFLQQYCLYWLEAMSLIGKIPEATTMMMKLESLVGEKNAAALQSLVQGIVRFTHTFSHVLSIAPLQIYSAGLIFSPLNTTFGRSFSADAPEDMGVMTQVPDEWNTCIQTLEGHSDAVNSLVFSPDGSRVASGSYDNTVRVWDGQTGQCQHTLEGHSGPVGSVVFSPDGSRVASGSLDKTVRVWDVQTGQCQHTLKGHSDAINSVVFLPNGSQVVSGSCDKTVQVWDVQTGQCQYTLKGHSDAINSVVFSPDGSRVASGSDDNTVRVWDVQTGQCQYTLKGHSGAIDRVVFSPDGSRVASGSYDYTVRVWDVQIGQCQYTLKGHSDVINSVVFSPDGSRVASGSDDNTARVWDVQTGQYQHTLKGHSNTVYGVVFSPDGSRVASGSDDKTVRVWDVQTGQCQYTLKGHSSGVYVVVFSPDGSRVASSSWDNTVRVWDVQRGQYQYTLKGHSGAINSVVFSPDGSRVASGSWDMTVQVWDVQTGQCQHTLKGHSNVVDSVVFSPDGSRVASGSWDWTVRVWDMQTVQCQHTLEGHSNAVYGVVFSPDGSRVASGSNDKTVRVWDVQTGQCQRTLKGHSDGVRSVVFSPDGSRVASGSCDKTVRVWDVQTGQCQYMLEGHSDVINSVVFSPDGSRVASGSDDNTARVWDVASMAELLYYDSGTYYPTITFSDDSTKIMVNGALLSIISQTSLPRTTAGSPRSHSSVPISELGVKNGWVTLSSERILWLPPEYRPGTWASYGDMVVVGSGTGRVTFVHYVVPRSSSS